MKKIIFRHMISGVCVLLTALLCMGCKKETGYAPTGEFYVKTAPAHGDTGASEVISLEAASAYYDGEGTIPVKMTVGFGHIPALGHDDETAKDTFYVHYKIYEGPWKAERVPAWEKKVAYTDSWYSTKYNATEPENHSFLFIPFYGEFDPLYKETVEIVFPGDVEKGNLEVELYYVSEEGTEWQFAELTADFTRENGVLELKMD